MEKKPLADSLLHWEKPTEWHRRTWQTAWMYRIKRSVDGRFGGRPDLQSGFSPISKCLTCEKGHLYSEWKRPCGLPPQPLAQEETAWCWTLVDKNGRSKRSCLPIYPVGMYSFLTRKDVEFSTEKDRQPFIRICVNGLCSVFDYFW